MKINKLKIKNKAISFENLSFDFDKYGLYIITGKNGVGKTTVIENIIFNNNNIEFNTPEQAESYEKNRHNLFTYVSQNLIVSNVSVLEYLTKGNEVIDKDAVSSLMDSFNLNDISLKQRFDKLSGGERIKLSIISGLLKETPYIFMDEPTNNLDDSSVEIFADIIEKLAKKRTIIIISHDPRLKFKVFNKIVIHDGIKEEMLFENTEINKSVCKDNKTNYFKLASNLFKSKISYVVFFCSLLLVLILGLNTHDQFEVGYSVDTVPSENMIFTYQSDCVYGELNKCYVAGAGLDIDSNNHYSMIRYDSIPDIAKMEGVGRIILADYSFFNGLCEDFYEGRLMDKLNIVSVPQFLMNNFADIMYWLVRDMGCLEEGRLPLDRANEISISKAQLKKYFGYNDEMANRAIGSKMNYNNKEYTIVGLQYYDICFISFDWENNLGFYQYKEDNFKDFSERNIRCKQSEDVGYQNEIDEMIICTENGKEKTVLNQVLKLYPAENYSSNQYIKIWKQQFNEKFIRKIYFFNILISALISISLLIISKNKLYTNYNKMKDYENYYITRKKIKNVYLILTLFQYILIMMISLLINSFFSTYSFITNNIILLNVVILFIPTLGYLIWRMKHV